MYKLTGIVMEVAPYGVFALIATTVGTHGMSILIPFAKLIFAVYLGVIIHEVVVYSGMTAIIAKMSPMKFFRGFGEASLLAFSTCSSSATLPVSMRCAQENLGVSSTISSFVQPLGATINMDGTALYQGVCALFVAQAYGIHLGFGWTAYRTCNCPFSFNWYRWSTRGRFGYVDYSPYFCRTTFRRGRH